MEMKASLCVGEYCETAYNIEELEIRVYCMEELCYCLKENAFLLDMSIMNDKLVDWIGEECRVRELAKQLYPMVHKPGVTECFCTDDSAVCGNLWGRRAAGSRTGAEAGIRTQQPGET